MRCHSLQALWGSAPPQHEITAILGLQVPLSVWTGAADGAIAVWKLSHPDSFVLEKEIWPLALLCGHTAAISHLEVCGPSDRVEFVDQHGVGLYSSHGSVSGRQELWDAHDAVVSICVEGFMCVWDGRTGHCRRRRRLPPWVGHPATVASFPNARRYLCICSNGPSSGSGVQVVSDVLDLERKPLSTRSAMPLGRTGTKISSKGIIVVVDSLTLTVVQVVYNGSLGIGVMASMTIVYENGSDTILVSDVFGKLRAWPGVVIDSGREGVWESAHEDRSEHIPISTEFSTDSRWGERAETVSLSSDGLYLLVVFRSRWLLKTVEDGTVLAERACLGNNRQSNDLLGEQFACMWKGGLFLPATGSDSDEGNTCIRILVWESDGGAVVYLAEDSELTFSVVAELQPLSAQFQGQRDVQFCSVDDLVIRSESLQAGAAETVVETRLCAWHLKGLVSKGSGNSLKETQICFRAGLWGDWLEASSSDDVCGAPRVAWTRRRPSVEADHGCTLASDGETENLSSCLSEMVREKLLNGYRVLDKRSFVTATMLLSGSSFVPSMLVYGYGSGEIRMVELEAIEFAGLADDPSPDHIFRQRARYFAGHIAPVLCLAEHRMENVGRVLLSGSIDSCVCVWDLREDGALVAVLHHHTSAVRQLVLPPPGTMAPWSSCFISVGDDACVAVVSLETLEVVRMFPGHPVVPKTVAWDFQRGYIAVLCPRSDFGPSSDSLYIWDVHSGARERILKGAAAHSMFSHFSARIRQSSASANNPPGGNATSASSLLPSVDEQTPSYRVPTALDATYMGFSDPNTPSALDAEGGDFDSQVGGLRSSLEKLSVKVAHVLKPGGKPEVSVSGTTLRGGAPGLLVPKQQPIKGACPMPGVAALQFELSTLMAPTLEGLSVLGKLSSSSNQVGLQGVHILNNVSNRDRQNQNGSGSQKGQSYPALNRNNTFFLRVDPGPKSDVPNWLVSVEGRLLRMSLSYLHLWGIDKAVDQQLVLDLHVYQPEHIGLGVGFGGDRGAMTLFFPSLDATFEPWRTCSEFCAMRSLTLVSLAQRLILLSKPASYACSELAGFYSRGLAEKLPGVISPCLEIYTYYWQDQSEHVRMAARTLFHCAALRAVPPVLWMQKNTEENSEPTADREVVEQDSVLHWLESYEDQYWTVMVGATRQDAQAARIIVASSLAVWYPTIVRRDVARVVAPLLLKMVRDANDRHVASVAEVLAEGMASTWQDIIGNQIRHLMVDVFDQIERLSNTGGTVQDRVTYPPPVAPAVAMAIRESLAGNLLPSLAMADVPGFLHIVQNQLDATASDSPVHRVALTVLIRCVRGAPKAVLPHLPQVTSLLLQTMETGNFSLRKQCMQTAMATIREMVRVFPMVALYPGSPTSNAKLAVGDPIGDIHLLAIHVYDLQNIALLKVLDASGPPGHSALLSFDDSSSTISDISALTFSSDGEGLVAFSLNGLIIRWWSLGAVWWERLSRTLVPVQCTKLLLVPPWAGFSPRSSSSSIMHMATISHPPNSENHPGVSHHRRLSQDSHVKLAYHSFDLSYRLEWRADKVVVLLHHGQELGSFQL